MNKKSATKKPTKKNKVGRPPKYETPEQLQEAIEKYFEGGYRKKSIVIGNKKDGYQEVEVPAITISDLVIYLGFSDRYSFYEYEKKEKFTYTIKKARTFIEREYEQLLTGANPAGAIFALKNFGWTDKQDVEHSGEITITRKRFDEPEEESG